MEKEKNIYPSISDIDMDLQAPGQMPLLERIEAAGQLPAVWQAAVIDGATIRFLRYSFGVLFTQKVVVRNYVFWVHRLSIVAEVTLHPTANKLLFTLTYMLQGTVKGGMEGTEGILMQRKYQIYGLASGVAYDAVFAPGHYLIFQLGIPYAMISELAEAWEDLSRLTDLYKTGETGLCDPHLFDISPAIENHIHKMLLQTRVLSPGQKTMRDFLWEEQLLRLFNQFFCDKENFKKLQRWHGHEKLKVDELKDYVYDHLLDSGDVANVSLQLRTLLRKMHLSETRFRKAMQQYYHCTWEGFVHSSRMQKALHLLETDRSQTVSDIAYLLGYSSVAHFSRAFKSFFKYAPSEHRKRHPQG